MTHYTWSGVDVCAKKAAEQILANEPTHSITLTRAYPIPQAGLFAALAIQSHVKGKMRFELTDDPRQADIYIDDVLDSGETIRKLNHESGLKPCYVLVDKQKEGIADWVSFPWDRMKNQLGPEENVKRILQYIGDDPEREGLKETPSRVVRSYADLFSGYNYKTDEDVGRLIKCFENGACDEMVLLKNIEFQSTCEHHMLPFFGQAHVAYIPHGKVVGVSKLARVVDVYSKRLQIQEQLTQQVTRCLDLHLQPKGSACILQAQHQCMTCRGVMKQNSVMVTSSLTGIFLEKPEARSELFNLIRS